MHRRTFVTIALTAAAWPLAAAGQAQDGAPAQGLALHPIEPANALEQAFVAALDNEAMRPIFRRLLLEAPVALALASDAEDAPPLERPLREGAAAGFIFTSAARLDAVFGESAPRTVIPGRAALERLRGKYAVLNYRLAPMLTLEPEDIARYLETPEASAGPAQ
jgi:hypothetical protein